MKMMKRLNRVIKVRDEDVEMYSANGYKPYDKEAEVVKAETKTDKPISTSNAGKALTQGALRALNADSQIELAKKHNVDVSTAKNKRERGDMIWAVIEASRGG